MAKTYAGKISNQGTQVVEALYPAKHPKQSKVKTGKDLRVKGGK